MSDLPGPLDPPGPGNDAVGSTTPPRKGTPTPVSSTKRPERPKSTLPLNTPIKHTSATYTPFSTFTRYRHRTMHVMGEEMKDYLVGPMPPEEFLSRFLPTSKIDGYHAVDFTPYTQSNRSPFSRTIGSKKEVDAYEPFIKEMSHFAPDLQFVDSHTRVDSNPNCQGFDFQIKPDVCVYAKPTSKDIACDSSKFDIHVEFKWDADHNPFCPPYTTLSQRRTFFRNTKKAKDTLGQVTAYTAAQFGSQFRTHTFSVLIVHDTARIIRWDREGAVVTAPIKYNTDPSLAEFFARYSQAPPELRGVDTTIVPAPEEDAVLARESLNLPAGAPMFMTEVPNADGHGTSRIVIPAPVAGPMAPIGRSTRACSAYDPVGRRIVFLKDSWRVRSLGVLPEGETYDKLNGAKVEHVATCIAHGDVSSWTEQKTQTRDLVSCVWACPPITTIMPHCHYRLVLDVVGQRLTDFASSRELVQAVHDALLAHERAYKLGILHRDISAGNIIIVCGRGVLIDWDLSKSLDEVGPRQITRTGTWQFMSARLVEDKNAPHGVADDMESSFYVVLWTALMFSPSTLSLEERSLFIPATFNAPSINRYGGQGKRGFLNSQKELRDRADLFVGRKPLDLLIRELADLFKFRYYIPTSGDIALYEKMSADPALLQYAQESSPHKVKAAEEKLQNHEAIIAMFAHHLASSLWPENDASVAQPLLKIEEPGDAGEDMIIFSKSTHTLEPVEERRSKRRKVLAVRTRAARSRARAQHHCEVDSDVDSESGSSDSDELPSIEGPESRSYLNP